MFYQIFGTARYKSSSQDPGIALPVRLEFQAANDDEALANINQVLASDGYTILEDSTLSPTQPWESLRFGLREIRPLAQLEFKKAPPTSSGISQ